MQGKKRKNMPKHIRAFLTEMRSKQQSCVGAMVHAALLLRTRGARHICLSTASGRLSVTTVMHYATFIVDRQMHYAQNGCGN